MDGSLPGFSVYGILQEILPALSSHSLPQGIFPTQALIPGLPIADSLPSEPPWKISEGINKIEIKRTIEKINQ